MMTSILRNLVVASLCVLPTHVVAKVTDMSSHTPLPGKTYEFQKKIDGKKRTFIVHLPKSYTGTQKMPVVFMFHGSGGTGLKYLKMSEWAETGEKYGFITVFPSALRTCLDMDGERKTKTYWMTPAKAKAVCDGRKAQNDLRFVDEILKQLKTRYAVDQTRVYSSGFSNGMGFTLTRLLAERSHIFAAVGGAGSTINEPITLKKEPITTVILLGEVDPLFEDHIPFATTARAYRRHEMLQRTTGYIRDALNLKRTYTSGTKMGGKVFVATYKTPKGSAKGHQFIMGIMKGVEHKWPNGSAETPGLLGAEYLWSVFSKYRK